MTEFGIWAMEQQEAQFAARPSLDEVVASMGGIHGHIRHQAPVNPPRVVYLGDDGYTQMVRGVQNIPTVYSENLAYYGSHAHAVNATANPMFTVISAGYELKTGVGIRAHNSAVELTDDDRFANWVQIGFSSAQAVGYGVGGALASRSFIPQNLNSHHSFIGTIGGDATPLQNSLWSNRAPGVQVRRYGDWWVKRVNPDSNMVMRWWGEQSINSQYQGLQNLGNMATPNTMRAGVLFTRDVGPTFSGGRFSLQSFNPTVMRSYAQGSVCMRTPFNDIIPRNIGRNGLIFDPSIDWFTQSLTIGGGAGATWGLLEVIDYWERSDNHE